MKTKGFFFLLITTVFSVFVIASLPGKKGAETRNHSRQKHSFQVEDWEKDLNLRQPPIKIMDAIGLKPGMIIGEVGAGTGRMTIWLADRVGKSGKVYANDIDRNALDYLKKRCRKDVFKNVEIIVGKMDNPRFPTGILDIAFMINVYHHLADPVPILQNLLPGLKVNGVLAIVECDPDKVDWGDEHGCSRKEDMINDLKQAGFKIVRFETFMDEYSIYIARTIISF